MIRRAERSRVLSSLRERNLLSILSYAIMLSTFLFHPLLAHICAHIQDGFKVHIRTERSRETNQTPTSADANVTYDPYTTYEIEQRVVQTIYR